MKTKLLYLVLLSTITLYSQTQIGAVIDGEAAGDNSGKSISLSSDGSTVAIGAPYNAGNGGYSGHVRVYKNNSGVWTQLGADIDGETKYSNLGTSVSLSSDGNTVAIGAPWNAGNGSASGHVRIYKNSANVWTQIGADIDGEAVDDQSGTSVSLSSDGSTVAIGAPNNDENGSNSGHVRVYKNNSGVWTQIGADINGEEASDRSGSSVSLSYDGSIVAIGAPANAENGSDSGHVRVYKNNSGVWTQIGTDIDGEEADDQSGASVSLSFDGSTVAIGAPYNNGNGSTSGHVRVYKNNSGIWTQLGADIDGEATFNHSGKSVSLSSDGSMVAIGAPNNAGNGNDSGHVRIYKNSANVWTQIGTDIDGEAADDQSGANVSLSSDGSTVAIGVSENRDRPGHVRIYDLSALLSLKDNK